jgi:transcriptional regulator with XRE-family HTH domain
MDTMGERIKTLREEKGWSQSELARRVGVERAAVSQWESGQTKELKGKNLDAVCRELECRSAWLISGKGPRQEQAQVNDDKALYLSEKQRLLVEYIKRMSDAEQEHYLREFSEKEQAERDQLEYLRRKYDQTCA